MSPSSREINGPRPARLKVHKDSHNIHKPTPSSSSTAAATQLQQQRHHHHPVIIYTHSPKVIHAHARDFMALVQKLTGLSHADEEEARAPPPPCNTAKSNGADDSSSSSSENYVAGETHVSCSSLSVASTTFYPSPVSSLLPPEIPLFMPGTSEFCCAVKPSSYRYPEAGIYPTLTNIGGPIPPPVMDVMKPFSEFQ